MAAIKPTGYTGHSAPGLGIGASGLGLGVLLYVLQSLGVELPDGPLIGLGVIAGLLVFGGIALEIHGRRGREPSRDGEPNPDVELTVRTFARDLEVRQGVIRKRRRWIKTDRTVVEAVVKEAREFLSEHGDRADSRAFIEASRGDADPDAWLNALIQSLDEIARRLGPPAIHFKLDRSDTLAVCLRPGHPQSVLLEVGVQHHGHTNLKGVNANVLLPVGLKAGDEARCNLWGNHVAEGGWAPPTLHRICDEQDEWKEYWNAGDLTLNSGSRIFGLKLHLKHSGTYPVFAKFWGGDLPDPISKEAAIDVIASDGFGMPCRDRISELIYEGEQMLDLQPDPIADSAPPPSVVPWFLEAAQAIPAEHVPLLNMAQDEKQPQAGWKAGLKVDLRVLYDIRARLAVTERHDSADGDGDRLGVEGSHADHSGSARPSIHEPPPE